MKNKNSRRAKLGGRAVVYKRTSTRQTTTKNTGSLKHQRARRNWLLKQGWSPHAVEVIDEDIGRGGLPRAQRPGYEKLCRMVTAGEVGMVLVSDLARLSRSRTALVQFLELCRRTKTMVAVGGTIIDCRAAIKRGNPMTGNRLSQIASADLNDPTDRLMLRLQVALADYENEIRRRRLMAATRAKAHNGHAVRRNGRSSR